MLIKFLFITLVLFVSVASSTTWMVDNRPGADFNSLLAAHSNANAGDTILVAGSAQQYQGLGIAKKLTIIGPGYFLDENTALQANQHPAQVEHISLGSGSEGSVIMGLTLVQGVTFYANNLRLKRCLVSGQPGSSYSLFISPISDSIYVTQCYISAYAHVFVNGAKNAIYFYNNYMEHTNSPNQTVFYQNTVSNGEISNNIFLGVVNINGTIFNNNIMIDGIFLSTGSTPYNNIGNSTQFDSTNGNQQNVNMNDVFFLGGSTDAQWKINANGPAHGTGFGGVDCGMYDNSAGQGYKLSGIPPFPAIYEFTTDSVLSNVTVRIRSND